MASFLCAPSSLPLITITKTNTHLQLPPKQKSLVSVHYASSHSQARDDSKKFIGPKYSLTHQAQIQLSIRTPRTSAKASSKSGNTTETEWDQTVEHIVFLQMREAQDKPWDLKNALNSLKCLPGTLYLSGGYVGETYGAPGSPNYFLHSRLATKIHRNRFMQHPLKYGFSIGYTEGLCDDFLMLDYIYKHQKPLHHPVYGSALRFVFLKLKEGVDESSIQYALDSSFPNTVTQKTFGRIIEPCFTVPGTETDCVKGYNFAMHAEFPNKETLDSVGTPKKFAEALNVKIGKELLSGEESIFIHDYNIEEVYTSTFLDSTISGF